MSSWESIAVTAIVTLIFSLNTHTNAWHENLGIDSSKAAELYKSSPNDPAISQWKNALQLAINGMDKCFDVETAVICRELITTITNNCNSHPNELLACSDIRLAQYPSILKEAEEAQKKVEEAKKQAQKEKRENLTIAYLSNLKETAANLIIDRCIKSSSGIPKFELTDTSCNGQLSKLREDCQNVYPVYNYCKDQLFVGYLNELTQPNPNLAEQGCLGTLHTMTDGRKICVRE